MDNLNLFLAQDGNWVTANCIRDALRQVVSVKCKVLYMHSGLTFGAPNPAMKRKEILEVLFGLIQEVGVPTLCVPTFTFSFCNGEDYDLLRSKSSMGALNEFIRQRPEATRSMDPLMSIAVIGERLDLATNLGHSSIGAESTFDKLDQCDGVEFLLFGKRTGDCLTYMHYLEWVAGVPYRYERPFTGRIHDAHHSYEDTYNLFVRYNNVHPNAENTFAYEDLLRHRGHLKFAGVGDSRLQGVPLEAVRSVYLELLSKDPFYFIMAPFHPAHADENFHVSDMVAL